MSRVFVVRLFNLGSFVCENISSLEENGFKVKWTNQYVFVTSVFLGLKAVGDYSSSNCNFFVVVCDLFGEEKDFLFICCASIDEVKRN